MVGELAMTGGGTRLAGQIEVSGICRSFGRAGTVMPVIADCNLTIAAGRLTVLIGPSGCGKSTLAKLIAGYDTPSAGTITIDGVRVSGAGRDRLMVFQESALFNWMTTLDNALFGPRQGRSSLAADATSRVSALLELVGLKKFARRYPTALSGGMQRRLEMVRALATEPKLLILDEPFRGLDAMTRALMQEHFASMFERTRRTTLFITTEIEEALLLADRIVVMTNKPMKVAEIIEVNLPRPRRIADLFESEEANRIKGRALDLLFPEAMKSFL